MIQKNFNLKFNINNINKIQINLSSPKTIQNWSKREQILDTYFILNEKLKKYSYKKTFFGEITNPFIVDVHNEVSKFSERGLFCEKIFGPLKDYTCLCGKPVIKQSFFQDCKKCNVTLTKSKIRSYRLGYIPLIVPVFNVLFFLGLNSFSKFFLNLTKTKFMELIYFNLPKKEYLLSIKNLDYIFDINNQMSQKLREDIKKVKTRNLMIKKEKNVKILENILTNFESCLKQYLIFFTKNNEIKYYLNNKIFKYLETYDVLKELNYLNYKLQKKNKTNQNYKTILKKYRILENFQKTKTNLSWVFFKNLPVTPPNFRPYDINDETSVSSKINFLYQNIIRINNRIFTLLKINLPQKNLLLLNEIRLLQESVDFLIDNNKVNKKFIINDKPLKSLSDILKGKSGRFRQTIMGKRINFSARSVIIVNPFLKLNQCAIPLKILVNLFSYKITKLIKNIFPSQKITKKNITLLYIKILQKIIKNEVVMLNRAPTLHKLGIQAFNFIITPNDALHLHPLVCSSYNADFDGDQMSVYFPLTKLSTIELNSVLKSTTNFFLFGNSDLKMKPTQELILGLNYLTLKNEKIKYYSFGNYFIDYNDFLSSFLQKKLNIHSSLWIKLKKEELNYIKTTPGRLLLNKIINNNY